MMKKREEDRCINVIKEVRKDERLAAELALGSSVEKSPVPA